MARRRLERAQLDQERNHRITSVTFHPTGTDQRVVVTDHLVSVPLFRDGRVSNERLDVFFRIVEKDTDSAFFERLLGLSPKQRASIYIQDFCALQNLDDVVLYLQGGPGFGAPTPVADIGVAPNSGSWIDAALHKHNYKRVVLLDQRGTGNSSPVTKQTLERKFPNLFLLDGDIVHNRQSLEDFHETHPEEVQKVQQAVETVTDYLAQFRADNIVQDAEYIREALLLPDPIDQEPSKGTSEPKPWGCSLGQSYGGFCSMTYMSQVEHPPRVMLLTGGIAPMLSSSNVETVYGDLWDRVKDRSLLYYDMFPEDVGLVKTIVRKLMNQPASLPSGGRLTARRFLSLGIALGSSPSSFASLHEFLGSAFVGGTDIDSDDLSQLEFSRSFLKGIDTKQSFDDAPIYFWMHETIYADGPSNSPTSWAANRALENKINAGGAEFDYQSTCQTDDHPILFFGEHVFPWMPEDFAELSGVGLRQVANSLAEKTDWKPLYDSEHMKLVHNSGRTRSAAAVYHEDMYVEFNACMKVAKRDGPLGRTKCYVTNEYQHSGLRDNGAGLFTKLHGMAKGGVRTPS